MFHPFLGWSVLLANLEAFSVTDPDWPQFMRVTVCWTGATQIYGHSCDPSPFLTVPCMTEGMYSEFFMVELFQKFLTYYYKLLIIVYL